MGNGVAFTTRVKEKITFLLFFLSSFSFSLDRVSAYFYVGRFREGIEAAVAVAALSCGRAYRVYTYLPTLGNK
ncbi:hypothetical protein F4781DRAFT_293566 [Annulohypoxylon bovei var. microspora]|nr:hypothetical protein F4781DRAFT_293566 [Annulohypoxylon bovei var. microspora]